MKNVSKWIALGVLLLLSVMPLQAQDMIEISYKNEATPAMTLQLADIGKMWFADDMLQANSVATPTKITKLALADIGSIKFKNSQTDVKRLNVTDAEQYVVYDLQGRQVLVTRSMSAVNALSRGVYVVRSNNKTIKISK